MVAKTIARTWAPTTAPDNLFCAMCRIPVSRGRSMVAVQVQDRGDAWVEVYTCGVICAEQWIEGAER